MKQLLIVIESKIFHHIFLLFSIFIFGFIIYDYFSFIWINSVNLIYWDQWDFYNTLFKNQSYLDTFLTIHGPHRQGLSFVIDRIILDFTSWNNKWESIFIGILYFIASLIALLTLKYNKKIIDGLDIIVVGLIFLNKNLLETCLFAANPAHGAFPILGIVFIIYYFFKNKYSYFKIKDLFIIIFLTYLTTFSGFGVFIGLVIPFVYFFLLFFSPKVKIRSNVFRIIFFFLSFLPILLFFINYQFESANPNFKFPHDPLIEYFSFIGYMLANLFSANGYYVFGEVILILLIISIIYSIFKLYYSSKNTVIHLVNLTIASYLIVFLLNVAIGRVSLSLRYGEANRYLPYMFLFYFLIFLYIEQIKYIKSKLFLKLLLIFVLSLSFFNSNTFEEELYSHSIKKHNFIACMRDSDDLKKCNESYPIYPELEPIVHKVEFLKENKLNFYSNF